MLISDDRDDLIILGAALQHTNCCDVWLALGRDDAMARVKDVNPGVLILPCKLGEQTGLELLAAIQKHVELPNCKALLLAADSETEYELDYRDAGIRIMGVLDNSQDSATVCMQVQEVLGIAPAPPLPSEWSSQRFANELRRIIAPQ